MLKFGERLKELRLSKNLTQVALSKELNNKVTKSAICYWELNMRIPSLEAAWILADFFGVSIDYISGRED